jgi:hypothetical protein
MHAQGTQNVHDNRKKALLFQASMSEPKWPADISDILKSIPLLRFERGPGFYEAIEF